MAHRNAPLPEGNSAGVTTEIVDGTFVLHMEGRWDLAHARRLDAALGDLAPPDGARRGILDLTGVEMLDTAGAWLIDRTRRSLEARGLQVELRGVSSGRERLLAAVAEAPDAAPAAESRPDPLAPVIVTGEAAIAVFRQATDLIAFFGLLSMRLARAALQPRRLRPVSLAHHVQATGLAAMPIVGLLSFLIGVVLAYQGALQLREFGAEIFVVNLLGISILRELGILITAIIVAGRSGSAFTAQIGTMVVNQEVDAMRTLGLDPADVLVLPRLLALVVSLPLLTFYANLVALFGGATMSYFVLDISYGQFMRQLQDAVPIAHFWVGLVKAPVFAFTIAMVGCYQGLRVTGSAESVGRLTTTAVVQSIFLVIVLDALFSILFASVGF